MGHMVLCRSKMTRANSRWLCVVQSGMLQLDSIFAIGRMMCRRNYGLHPVQIYSIRRPIDVHSPLFESNNAVDSRFDCLDRNQRGPWLALNQLRGQYEWLAHIGSKCDLNPAVDHRIQLSIQYLPGPNLCQR